MTFSVCTGVLGCALYFLQQQGRLLWADNAPVKSKCNQVLQGNSLKYFINLKVYKPFHISHLRLSKVILLLVAQALLKIDAIIRASH